MTLIETAYLVSVAAVVLAGFVMIGLAVDAYWKTKRPAMIHLTVGFALIAAASAGTALGAVMSDYSYVRALLVANSGFTALGYVFVIYSLRSYRTAETWREGLPGFEFVTSRVGRFFP